MHQLAALLRDAPAHLADKRVTAGFDGFVDRILRPVYKITGESREYFETIADFGAFLQRKTGKSCSVELDVQTHKVGGNCPIFSSALGACGVAVDCIGMFGGASFDAMPPSCRRHSYAEAGTADCLEFGDGKVLLAARCAMEGDPFSEVSAAVPALAELYASADLAALLNWSELEYATALWTGVYERIFANTAPDHDKTLFFDLCDIARKSAEEIERVLCLIGRFGGVRHTVLSLNENECQLLGGHIGVSGGLETVARALAARYGVHEVVVHTLHRSCVLASDEWHERPTIFCEKPVLSTGAGDNFNAGYCLGILLEQPAQERLAVANLAASRYITLGQNVNLAALADYADSL